MSSSRFVNKVPGQTIFRGKQVDFCHNYISLDAYCCHFLLYFYIVVNYLGGGIVPWPHPCRPFAEIRDRFKEKTYLF